MNFKILSAACVLLILTACATKPTPPEGIEHPAPKTVTELVGKNRGQIHRMMGGPAVTRVEEEYTLWSYAQGDSHAVLVYFDKAGLCQHAEIRTASLQTKKSK